MYNIEELPWLQSAFLILDPSIGIHYHVIWKKYQIQKALKGYIKYIF